MGKEYSEEKNRNKEMHMGSTIVLTRKGVVSLFVY